MNRVGILVSGWLGAILWLLLGRQVTQLAEGAAPLSLVNLALVSATVGAAFLLGLFQAWLVLTMRGPSVKEGNTTQPSVVPSATAINATPQDWQRDDIRGLTSSLDRLYSHFAADPAAAGAGPVSGSSPGRSSLWRRRPPPLQRDREHDPDYGGCCGTAPGGAP